GSILADSFEELKRRCEAAGLRYEEDREHEALVLHFPRGREKIEVHVAFDEEAQQLLRQPFETYRAIQGFQATWSSEQGVIECNLLWPSLHTTRPDARVLYQWGVGHVLQQLGLDVHPNQINFASDQRAEFSTRTGLSISIGPCSDMHGILLYPMDFMDFNYDQDPWRTLTIRIEGVVVGRHDDAVQLLRDMADSTLFHIDISRGLYLALQSESDWARGNAPLHHLSLGTGAKEEIRYEYDRQPMSLYWHGKRAEGMPLLQFLAYYQVLEFYFPRYSEAVAAEALKTILKEPTFDPTAMSDISRLLRAVKYNSRSKAFGSEAEQLRATICGCVSAEELQDWLSKGDRYGFYTSKRARRIAVETLPLLEKSGDVIEATANRVNAIRNRIVHTKGGSENREPLFPFDTEVNLLEHDLDLVHFLARKALIASSKLLRV
ncbi:MAG: hypothetical protein AVDCRST_MAG93-136, partial [uncultured Chloroflexia bacterium]